MIEWGGGGGEKQPQDTTDIGNGGCCRPKTIVLTISLSANKRGVDEFTKMDDKR